jgi:phage-related protein (TIGR01555 family)
MKLLSKFADGLANVLTGMGVPGRDKGVTDRFVLRPLQKLELEAAYRCDWVARKSVDIIPGDMTREWREWKTDKAAIKALEETERTLKLKARVRRALRLADLYGGAAMIMGVAQGSSQDELDLKHLGKGSLRYIHVVNRHQLTVEDIDRDPESPFFMEPKMYSLAGVNGAVRIHPSRVVRFLGNELPDPDSETANLGWGDPVLQSVYDAVLNAAMAQTEIAALIREAKIDIIQIPELMDRIGTKEYEDRLSRRLTVAAVGKSVHNALIMDANEKWEQRQVNFSQLPEILQKYLTIASAARDIPVTRFLSQSPGGLNSTGDGDMDNYQSKVSSEQEEKLCPALDKADQVIARSALGAYPPDLWYELPELRPLSEKDRADISYKRAQTTQIYVNSQLIPESALAKSTQNQLIESGDYPGLEEAMAEAEKAGEIAPIEEEPAEPDPNAPPAPVQSAAGGEPRPTKDAEPRTLYVSRKVLNAADIVAWAKAQGFTKTIPAGDMHVTIAFSRQPVDWMKAGSAWAENDKGQLTIKPGGARLIERLGADGKAVVLLFSSSELSWRHEDIKRNAGASWDWPEYQPHITISYDARDMDLAKVKPYSGEIVFGPEIFEEVKNDWETSIEEA